MSIGENQRHFSRRWRAARYSDVEILNTFDTVQVVYDLWRDASTKPNHGDLTIDCLGISTCSSDKAERRREKRWATHLIGTLPLRPSMRNSL